MAVREPGSADCKSRQNFRLKISPSFYPHHLHHQILMIKKLLALFLCVGAARMLAAQTPDLDGVALLAGPAAGLAAGLECAGSEIAGFEPGVKLFLNRDYPAKEVPEALHGFRFIRGNIDRVRAICKQAGVVYVVTPSPNRSLDSRETALLEQGFKRSTCRSSCFSPASRT